MLYKNNNKKIFYNKKIVSLNEKKYLRLFIF